MDFPENAHKIASRTESMGHQSALVPKTIFQWPIWLQPKTATAAGTRYMRQWVQYRTTDGRVYPWHYGLQVLNASDRQYGRASSAGALRWIDLDVLMALSAASYRARSMRIEIEQVDILRWMGYQNLLSAPYDEFRASLSRLAGTTIEHWSGLERPAAPETVSLLSGFSLLNPSRAGSSRHITVNLSDFWMTQISRGNWQEVDLDAYAHLARKYRMHGLVRALFCWFTAHRTTGNLNIFVARKDDMFELFRPRKPDGRGVRYNNPLHPNSSLTKALNFLQESGLIEPSQHVDPAMVSGFLHPEKADRLIDCHRLYGRQESFLNIDIWSGGTPSLAPAEQPKNEAAAPLAIDQAVPIGKLLTACRVSRSVIDDAKKRGWDDAALTRLMLVALYRKSKNEIRAPAGWAASIIRDGNPAEWALDALPAQGVNAKELRTWARGPDGPIPA
jgi:hypothetical protein